MPPCPKPKKQKRTERQRLDDECCEYLKQIVRLRDKTCVTPSPSCGGYLCASHWVKRGKKRCKYDLRNVNCQCSNCNQRHNHYTSYYNNYMRHKYGEDVMRELDQMGMLVKYEWSIPELREIRDGLRQVFLDLGGVE